MSSRPRNALALAALPLLCLAAFWPTFGNGFSRLDDQFVVVDNPNIAAGLTPRTILWALTHSYASNWYPLTWISHAADISLFGLAPWGHHLTSLLLHIAAAVALHRVLLAATGTFGRSLLAAAIFAVHPIQVESVAWAAERSNVLSGLLWFIALAAWLRYVRRPTSGRYLLAAAAFALGLMSKPMLVTFPVVLLVLDWWPLGRFRDGGGEAQPSRRPPLARRLVLEKLPLLTLSLVVGVLTLLAQRAGRGLRDLAEFSVAARVKNALVSLLAYLGDLAWPHDLSPYRAHPGDHTSWGIALAAGTALAAITAVAWALRRRRPSLLAGLAWYLVVLFPVLGLLQAGYQARADRFAYLSHVGISLALLWGIAPPRRRLVGVVALAALVSLAAAANLQTRLWRDSREMAERVVRRQPDNWMALNNLATSHLVAGDHDAALGYLVRAARAMPGSGDFHYNIAVALQSRGDLDAALWHLGEAIRLSPDVPKFREEQEVLRGIVEQFEQSVGRHRARIASAPRDAQALVRLARMLADLGRSAEAVATARQAAAVDPDLPEVQEFLSRPIRLPNLDEAELRLGLQAAADPGDPGPLVTLGALLLRDGRPERAVAAYEEAVRRSPRTPSLLNNLGVALAATAKPDLAESRLREALALRPDYPDALYNLGRLLAASGNFQEAVALLEHAVRLEPESTDARTLLEALRSRPAPPSGR